MRSCLLYFLSSSLPVSPGKQWGGWPGCLTLPLVWEAHTKTLVPSFCLAQPQSLGESTSKEISPFLSF